jgi:hypothetical protein
MKYCRRLQAFGTVGVYVALVRQFRTIAAGEKLPVATSGKCNQNQYRDKRFHSMPPIFSSIKLARWQPLSPHSEHLVGRLRYAGKSRNRMTKD